MDQPIFHRNEATGEVEEYQPVKVKREDLVRDVETEQKAKDECDKTVKAIEDHKVELETKLKDVTATLDVALTEQEAQNERVAFRANRLAGFDAVLAADRVAADEVASSVVENDVEPEPTAGQPSPEDVADALGLEADPDEQVSTVGQAKPVPIRRHARV